MEGLVYLFKYFEPARTDVIEDSTIRLTQPVDFNDPFEFKPVVSSVATQEEFNRLFEEIIDAQVEKTLASYPLELRNLIPEKQLIEKTREFIKNNEGLIDSCFKNLGKETTRIFNEKSNELIGVFCLTEQKDNLLMWSHYADSHRGFCVKFDASDSFFDSRRGDKDEFYHLREVKYLAERPNKTLINMSGIDLLLLKSDVWAYEKEWRFCGVLNDSDIQRKLGASDIHLFKYPQRIVKEIILGVNATQELENKFKLIISENSGLSHVKLSKAKISETEYSLEFDDL
ncbi:hypothetical protein AWH60_06135 [Pseudoalteromonas haloplanktis]|nr:hypothetical protein AWH60_06135 [Pseudoalteromonas haloplanktis]